MFPFTSTVSDECIHPLQKHAAGKEKPSHLHQSPSDQNLTQKEIPRLSYPSQGCLSFKVPVAILGYEVRVFGLAILFYLRIAGVPAAFGVLRIARPPIGVHRLIESDSEIQGNSAFHMIPGSVMAPRYQGLAPERSCWLIIKSAWLWASP